MIILTGSKTTRRADWRVVVLCLIWILAAPLTAVADDPPKTGDAVAVAAAFKAIELAQPKTARSAIAKIEAPLLRKALTWFMMRDLDAAGDTLEISAFLRENPTWPDRRRLRRQAERAIPANWTATAVKAWFDGSEPVSDLGRARLGDALADLGFKAEGVALLRQAWIDGDFTPSDERAVYRRIRRDLSAADHRERLERVLWDGRFGATRRMLPRVPEDIRKLGEARFLLRHRRGNVDKAIARVPDELKRHEGLVYERLRWRRRKGRTDSAMELFADAPPDPVRPDLWAEERIELARQSLADGAISEAYNVARNHGLDAKEAALFSEAEWLAGWIALRFLNEPAWAYDHFRALYTAVSFPISRSRGAYWAGRAAENIGDTTSATIWYSVASSYPETFYGQLALSRLKPGATLALPFEIARDPLTIAEFNAFEPARAAKALVEAGAREHIGALVMGVARHYDAPGWQSVVAIFARSLGRPDLAIRIAKLAARNGQLIPSAAYPTVASFGLPVSEPGSEVEAALLHAVIRQESLFFPEAKSRAGALGLMQLMPATARQVAKQLGVRYNRNKLRKDPGYNRSFGDAYLGNLLKTFDGSYILSIAAYNAGPNRARRWVRAYGDPRDPDVDAIDWIESIPFDETRNYVQRVLENLQVYRAVLGGENAPVQLAQDLVR